MVQESEMTNIRQYCSGLGQEVCGKCKKAVPEITIEDYPTRGAHVSLCANCAAVDLQKDSYLLAFAVVKLVVRTGSVCI